MDGKSLVEEISRALDDGRALPAGIFNGLDVDASLDLRDGAAFESEWLRAFDAVMRGEGADTGTLALIDSIRERAFTEAMLRSGSPEIAACASDDFELISRAAALDFEDPWVNGLLASYLLGTFPAGVVRPSNGSLEGILRVG